MQWLMLAVTCVFMALLQRLARAGPIEARAALALGFLLLVAHLGGSIARVWRLPRITGYLVAGIIVGPAWLGLVRAPEVAALNVFGTGALALIAFGAGLMIKLPARREERITALRIAGHALAWPFLAVTLVLLSISPWFPITAHQPFRDALTIALILGAFAALSSPVLTAAVITDVVPEGERSRSLARTIFNVSVVQDFAVLVLMLVVLAVAQPLASWGAIRPGIALETGLRLGGSLLAGGLLALILAEYLKVIQRTLVLVLVALAFIIMQAEWQLGLDAVLIALGAGLTLANLAPVQADVISTELKKCAQPIHIVFFALAGAAIQLGALAELWPWALLLMGLRIAGLRAGVRRVAAAREDSIESYGWLGLVSQGGLALSLAAVVRRAFPEWNVSLEALLVAMIGAYQLAGPVCFHWALKRSDAGFEGAHETEAAAVAVTAGSGGV